MAYETVSRQEKRHLIASEAFSMGFKKGQETGTEYSVLEADRFLYEQTGIWQYYAAVDAFRMGVIDGIKGDTNRLGE